MTCGNVDEATIVVANDFRCILIQTGDGFCVCENWLQPNLLYHDNMVRLAKIISFSVGWQEREAVGNFAMTGLSINSVTDRVLGDKHVLSSNHETRGVAMKIGMDHVCNPKASDETSAVVFNHSGSKCTIC